MKLYILAGVKKGTDDLLNAARKLEVRLLCLVQPLCSMETITGHGHHCINMETHQILRI